MPTIYLSSTFEDLKDFRQAVLEGLRRSEYHVLNMENYVAGAQRPVEKCLNDVAKADLYIGLFAFRYGYIPPTQHQNPQGLSITELEYRKAQELQKPYLVFVAKEDAGIPLTLVDACTGENDKGEKINAFRKELLTETLVSQFSHPQQLAMLVLAAVKTQLEQLAHSVDQTAQLSDVPSPVIWDINKEGSPYPGLLHYTRKFAPVFCGREQEVGEVLDRMRQPENRFLLISGASGSGKSSLVDAGVLPKIEDGVLSSDRPYTCVRIVPSQGSHLFDALVRPLHALVERAGFSAFELAENLLKEPKTLSGRLREIVSKGLQGNGLVVFLDQMEEVFTVRDVGQAGPFLSAMYQAAHEADVPVIATIRSDFLSCCYDLPEMRTVINRRGHIALGPADAGSIREMIRRPARCAGLGISDSLVRRMAQDVGSESGNLPLLAFALEQLFDRRNGNELTEAVYEQDLGGLTGAIRMHAGKVENHIAQLTGAEPRDVLPKIFAPLVVMMSEGQPTRRRVRKDSYDVKLVPVVDLLIKERLLQGEEGEQAESLVSIAHEKLFQAWPSLAQWVSDNQHDLFTLRQAEMQAGEWERHGYDPKYLWHVDRHRTLPDIIGRFGEQTIKGESGTKRIHQFATPQNRLIECLKDSTLSHQERLTIGQYLTSLGDARDGVGVLNGLPDIEWIEIQPGQIKLRILPHEFEVPPFRLAKYLVTNIQFQAFIDAADGYQNKEWWDGLKQSEGPSASSWSEANCPREGVSWYEAMAFCRWLSHRTSSPIRLPTEWEWQQAATGGDPTYEYPWKGGWEATRSNSNESRMYRTTPVGINPNGATQQGVMDMAGNVYEWCLNQHKHPDRPEVTGRSLIGQRAIRGGSWKSKPDSLRSSVRHRNFPAGRSNYIGFRLAQDIP